MSDLGIAAELAMAENAAGLLRLRQRGANVPGTEQFTDRMLAESLL